MDFELQARLVIGADGSHSGIARQCGLVSPIPRLQRVALVTHWDHVGGSNDTIEMRASGTIVCGLSFPGPGDAANLTLVAPPSAASGIAGRARDWIQETLVTHFPDVAQRLGGAHLETDLRAVGCFGHRCKPAVSDGVILVGDAATFIDPITGEGIFFALRGAQFAAEAAGKALRAGDVSRKALRPYCRARRELARRYILCDLVQWIARSPGLMHHAVRQLRRFPGAAERLLTILGGERSPIEALHPGFLWNLIAPEL